MGGLRIAMTPERRVQLDLANKVSMTLAAIAKAPGGSQPFRRKRRLINLYVHDYPPRIGGRPRAGVCLSFNLLRPLWEIDDGAPILAHRLGLIEQRMANTAIKEGHST